MATIPRVRLAWHALTILGLTLSCLRAAPPAIDPAELDATSAPVTDPGGLLDAPLPGDPMGVTVHALQNGMRVYISPESSAPVVSARIVVRAGAAHEPDHATGLAHYLEHLLFKGTDRIGTVDWDAERVHLDAIADAYERLARAPDLQARRAIEAEIDAATQASAPYLAAGEMSALLTSLGVADFGAQTGYDATAFNVSDLPRGRLEAWAELEAERLRAPSLRLFFPELETVFEEYNRTQDDGDFQVNLATLRVLFPGHPYARSIIGRPEHLRVPAFAETKRFFDDWYAPSNLAVILAGDVTPVEALPILERTLGQLPSREVPERAARVVAADAGGRSEAVTGDEGSVSLVWSIPSPRHDDWPAIGVANELLDESLLARLVPRSNLNDGATSSLFPFHDGSGWRLDHQLGEGQEAAAAEATLLAAVQALAGGRFSDEALAAAILEREIARALDFESIEARADRMEDAFTMDRNWADVVADHHAMADIDRHDVIRVARRYLSKPHGRVLRRVGSQDSAGMDPPEITPLAFVEQRSEFAREFIARPYAAPEPQFAVAGEDYVRRRIDSGLLLASHNAVNSLFALEWSFAWGSGWEPTVCAALAVSVTGAGTPTLTAAELQLTLDRLGIELDVECWRRGVTVRLSGLDRSFDQAVALAKGWLQSPRFDDPDVRERVEAYARDRKAQDATEGPLIRGAYDFAAYGAASPTRLGTTGAQIRALTAEHSAKLLARLSGLEHQTRYFGPRTAADVAAAVTLTPGTRAPKPIAPLRHRSVDGPTVVLTPNEATKSTLAILYPAAEPWDQRDPWPPLLNAYYGATLTGLLFHEIRVARGLAYVVQGEAILPTRPGDAVHLEILAQTGHGKVVEVLETALQTMAAPIDPERFAQAKRTVESAMRSWRWMPRGLPALVGDRLVAGHEHNPRRARWKALQAVDAEAFQAYVARLIAGPPIIMVLGNPAELDLEALGRIGTLEEVAASELFPP